MIKKGSKVQVLGIGKDDAHKRKEHGKKFIGRVGTITLFLPPLPGGMFSCEIKWDEQYVLDCTFFYQVKLKEVKKSG